jgi:hypothetical protein
MSQKKLAGLAVSERLVLKSSNEGIDLSICPYNSCVMYSETESFD